jgi:hypothetical protein
VCKIVKLSGFERPQQKSRKVNWVKNEDYFRMDGRTKLLEKKAQEKMFNSPDNKKIRLFLISTKAGGIGINLTGANRCVVFDASWNPSHYKRSIYKIYRMGQRKDVFIYRFLAQVIQTRTTLFIYLKTKFYFFKFII